MHERRLWETLQNEEPELDPAYATDPALQLFCSSTCHRLPVIGKITHQGFSGNIHDPKPCVGTQHSLMLLLRSQKGFPLSQLFSKSYILSSPLASLLASSLDFQEVRWTAPHLPFLSFSPFKAPHLSGPPTCCKSKTAAPSSRASSSPSRPPCLATHLLEACTSELVRLCYAPSRASALRAYSRGHLSRLSAFHLQHQGGSVG